MVDAITEQSKVTFQRVVREYQRKTCRELTRRRHRSGLAFQQSKPACLLQDMRIHWYDKCALVNETAPQTEVDRRTIPYHPTQNMHTRLQAEVVFLGMIVSIPLLEK